MFEVFTSCRLLAAVTVVVVMIIKIYNGNEFHIMCHKTTKLQGHIAVEIVSKVEFLGLLDHPTHFRLQPVLEHC